MDQEDIDKMIDAVADARVELYVKHCMSRPHEKEAIVQLATQMLFQTCTLLQAVYDGNADITKRHISMLLYSDAP